MPKKNVWSAAKTGHFICFIGVFVIFLALVAPSFKILSDPPIEPPQTNTHTLWNKDVWNVLDCFEFN